METFEVRYTPEGSTEIKYTVVPQPDESFLILINNAPACSIRMKNDETATWKTCEGSLSDEEIDFISNAIESRYT